MLERGDLEDNAAGQALMTNFVDGVERYAPEYFGVAPDDRPQGRPAVVEEMAIHFEPKADSAGLEFASPETAVEIPATSLPIGGGQR